MPAETTFPFMGEIVTGENGYALVNAAFQNIWIVIVYSIGSIALAYHVSHGLWSALHTVGMNNTIWMARWKMASTVISWIFGIGFTAIALIQFLVY